MYVWWMPDLSISIHADVENMCLWFSLGAPQNILTAESSILSADADVLCKEEIGFI